MRLIVVGPELFQTTDDPFEVIPNRFVAIDKSTVDVAQHSVVRVEMQEDGCPPQEGFEERLELAWKKAFELFQQPGLATGPFQEGLGLDSTS